MVVNHSFWLQQPVFSNCDARDLESMLDLSSLASYRDGQIICQEGDASDHFALIISGQVEVLKIGENQEERLLRVMHPGDFFGEMSLFYPEQTRSATVRAASQVELLEIPLEDMRAFMKEHTDLAFSLMQAAISRFREGEQAAFQELLEKNRQLALSMSELEAAQEQLIQKETLEHELSLARQVQESFLPRRLPELLGWELATYWQPAHKVGGDFYDFIPLDEERLACVIGDVTGKGMPAALIMAITRNCLRATLRQAGSPGRWLAQMNDLLCEEMPQFMFVTTFLALVTPGTGEVLFANAGHCLPVHCCGGKTSELRATGMPLGLIPDLTYEESSVILKPEDWVLFYSDGLLEAHNDQREIFGAQRIHAAVRQANLIHHTQERMDGLVQEQARFSSQNEELEDDLTLVILSRS
jgi:serine phosphatase RsbU (regulator of sigma subunit)